MATVATTVTNIEMKPRHKNPRENMADGCSNESGGGGGTEDGGGDVSGYESGSGGGGGGGGTKVLKAHSTRRASRAVPHPSTDRALCRLTSEVRRDPVHSTRYGRERTTTLTRHNLTKHHHVAMKKLWHRTKQKRTRRQKLTAPEGLPGRSPTPVLTGPCAA
jgi:hypothetical protein